jgi:hypothetical protein
VCCGTLIFPKDLAVNPEELNKVFCPLINCVVLYAFALTSIETLLPLSPLVWYVAFKNLEPVDLNDGFNAIMIVRAAGEKLALDTP